MVSTEVETSGEIVARFIGSPDLKPLFAQHPTLKAELECAVRAALSHTYLDSRQVAFRWGVSVELLQKLHRIRTGPVVTKLSAGVLRYALLDVLEHEAKSRSGNGK